MEKSKDHERKGPCSRMREAALELLRYYSGNITIEICVDKSSESVIINIKEHNI